VRTLVTRPAAQARERVDALRARGIDAHALPLIDIVPPADVAPLRQLWARLDEHALLMFVSANAVLHFMQQRPRGAHWPATLQAAATGPGTAAALRDSGVPATQVAAPQRAPYDSEHLWQLLRGGDWHGRHVVVLRGEDGRDWLAERLTSAGAQVEALAAYGRRAPTPDAAGRRLLNEARAAPSDHLWLFSSSLALQHLAALGVQDGGRAPALASHPRIAQAARTAGFDVLALAEFEIDALARQIESAQGRSIQSDAS
jgi:uroporphyrinogen-III synthase